MREWVAAVVFALVAAWAAGAGAQTCPGGTHPGRDSQGVERCIENGLMTCPPGYTQQKPGGRWYCMSQAPVPAGRGCGPGGQMTAEKDGSRRCMLASYDKCPANFHTDAQPDGIHCVSSFALTGGPTGTPQGAPGTHAECPSAGFHLGRTAQGAERCIQNGLVTCPPGYTQQRMGRFYCMSQAPVPAGQPCPPGGQMTVERDGSRRCILGSYDKCPPGFHVDMLPGEQFACVR